MPYRYLSRGRRLALLLTAAVASLGAVAGNASAATTTFVNSSPIVIPDSGDATPYPSTINAVGLAGNVQKATVTLHSFTHTYADDIDALLVGPSGAKTILMHDVGGTADTGVIDLTFDQASLNALNTDDTATSGTYRPSTDGVAPDLPAPAPGGSPYPVDLSVFNNQPANGAWQLYIEDTAAGDSGVVGGGWSLALTAPVNSVKAGKPKLNKKKGTARIPVTVGDAGVLTLKGKGVKSAKKKTAGAGTVKLTVKAKGKTASKLNSTGKATAKVKVTFTPNGGTPNVVKKKIKLKKS